MLFPPQGIPPFSGFPSSKSPVNCGLFYLTELLCIVLDLLLVALKWIFKVLEGKTSLSGVEDESLLDLDDNMNKRKGQKV